MNERIKELAGQAGITTNIDTDYFEKDMNKWVDYFADKFAQLIVEECARIAAETPCPYTDATLRNQQGHTWDMACIESAKQIRKQLML